MYSEWGPHWHQVHEVMVSEWPAHIEAAEEVRDVQVHGLPTCRVTRDCGVRGATLPACMHVAASQMLAPALIEAPEQFW